MGIRSLAGLMTVALLAAALAPTGAAAAEKAAEMTVVDITQRPGLKSTELEVFGLRLGMPKKAVLSHLEQEDMLWGYYDGYLLTEKKFSDIIYVFDRTNYEAVGAALLRMNFDAEERVSNITLYPAMGKHLAGQSKRLVDQDVLEPKVRRSLLGKAARVESEELPIIDLKLDIFHYPARGFQIRHKHSYSKRTDEVYFSLVPPSSP